MLKLFSIIKNISVFSVLGKGFGKPVPCSDFFSGKFLLLVITVFLVRQISVPVNGNAQTIMDYRGQYSIGQATFDAARRVLDYQFDRADRESSPDKWMDEARRGIGVAKTVWAEMAGELFADSQSLPEFMEWSETELENRFLRWLLDRFFGSAIETSNSALLRQTAEAGRYLIYHTGPDGSIVYDTENGDPRVIRPGDEGYDFDEELLSWKKKTQDAAGREALEYHRGIAETYPELLAYINPGRKDDFEQKLIEAGHNTLVSLKNEFEAVLAREERYFTARRIGDILSLRKNSKAQSAEAIGEMLIDEARRACAASIALIEAKIETAKGGDEDIVFAGNQWLDEYQEQFKRGLQAWESAEERFLLRRLEWEQTAEKTFNEAIDTWNNVFFRFNEERRIWEEQVRVLLLEGEQFFAHASGALDAAIAAAKAEYEKESRIRTYALSGQLQAIAGMYVLGGTAAEQALYNINFWLGRYNELHASKTYPSDLTTLEARVDRDLSWLGSSMSSEKLILQELKTSLVMYRTYTEKAKESRELLMKELYIITGSEESGIFYPDDYETELLRARGELEYWKNRTALAEAVAAYAEALDAGRISSAEYLNAWEKAKAAYQELSFVYEGTEDAVKKAGDEVSAARDALELAVDRMKAADETLESVRRNYELITSVLGGMDAAYVPERLAQLKTELSGIRSFLDKTGENSPWWKFLSDARELVIRQQNEIRKAIIGQLIAGNGEYNESLSPLYALASALLDGKKITQTQYDELVSLARANAVSGSDSQYRLRMAALALLVGEDPLTDWYLTFRLTDGNDASSQSMRGPDVAEQLYADMERAKLEFALARAELELEALRITGGVKAGGAASVLAALYTGDEISAAGYMKELERILSALRLYMAPENDTSGSLEKFLKDSALNTNVFYSFVSGGSYISAEYGLELSRVFLESYANNDEYCENLFMLFSDFYVLSPVVQRESLGLGIAQLQTLWETLGVNSGNRLFPEVKAILKALNEADKNEFSGIPFLVAVLDEIFYQLPVWIDFGYDRWRSNLIDYYNAPSAEILAVAERHALILDECMTMILSDLENKVKQNYEVEAALFLENPLRNWDKEIFSANENLNYDEYQNAYAYLAELYRRESEVKQEMASLSRLAELTGSKLPVSVIEAEINSISREFEAARVVYDSCLAEYRNAAENFRQSGYTYDSMYAAAEKAFNDREEARKKFDIQDAIRLWASSPYLDASRPVEELAYSREKNTRALNALALVESLRPGTSAAYANEYRVAYDKYRESLDVLALSMETLTSLEKAIAAETSRNRTAYSEYSGQLSRLGGSFFIDGNYVSSGNSANWGIYDLITVENGRLVFAGNSDNVISGADQASSRLLADYFAQNKTAWNEPNKVSLFELALRELSARLTSMNLSQTDYYLLGLGRDFLLDELADSNPGISEIRKWLRVADPLRKSGNLGNLIIDPEENTRVYQALYHHLENGFFQLLLRMHFGANYSFDRDLLSIKGIQNFALNTFDNGAKNDLEFYTILTLLGGGGINAEYFGYATEFLEYSLMLNYANNKYDEIKEKADRFLIGVFSKNDLQIISYTKYALQVSYDHIQSSYFQGYDGLKESLTAFNNSYESYKASSDRLAALNDCGSGIPGWAKIESVLRKEAGIKENLAALGEIWEQVKGEWNTGNPNVYGALEFLIAKLEHLHAEKTGALENVWIAFEQERSRYQTEYRQVYDAYMTGQAEFSELQTAAALSFAGNFPSEKAYIRETGTALAASMEYLGKRGLGTTDGSLLMAGELTGIISRAWENKYRVELEVRQTEWDYQRKDIQEKLLHWRESAAIILEQGRIAWKNGEENLLKARSSWIDTFRDEYEKNSIAWTAAYIEGLRDKEDWAAAVFDAAERASSSAVLALIGSGAEAGARAMDTRDPFDSLGSLDFNGGEKILFALLERSGIGNLTAQFGAIGNSAGTFATLVRTGLGSAPWASSAMAVEASILAKNVREEFETGETRKMVYMVMETAKDAAKRMENNVAEANASFRKSMDDTFIMDGQWRKDGSGYKKDVLVHSTLFDSVITDRASVNGYNDFYLTNIPLKMYTNGELPQNMNLLQAQAHINAIYSAINEFYAQIFGTEGDSDSGTFNVHVGTAPVIKSPRNMGKIREEMIKVPGSGEAGRLLTEFYYWMIMESAGIQIMTIAPWEKPMWDSRDKIIQAPSLRSTTNFVVSTVITIVGAVASPFTAGGSLAGSIALTTALYSASELTFTLMDVSGGYKTWGEAGLSFGKTVLTNAVASTVGSVFNGMGSASNAFFRDGGVNGLIAQNFENLYARTALKTVSAGVQSFTTGTVNSAVNAVTVNNGSLAFDSNAFGKSFTAGAINALTATVSSAVSGMLDLTLDGFTDNQVTGNSYYTYGKKLHNLAGGLSGQGVNYALTNDFTLNILNAGIFFDKTKNVNAGLLEMHITDDGVNVRLGSGGADVSIGTMIAAVKGLETWKVNTSLLFSEYDAAREYAVQMRSLYSMKGIDDIQRAQYDSILAGTTLIEKRKDADYTESVLNSKNGIKTIYLGSDALNDGFRHSLSVFLAHESHRNGINDDYDAQTKEGENAVKGHNEMAYQIIQTYGTGTLSRETIVEASLFNHYSLNNYIEELNFIFNNYDFSGDYWKLTEDGRLEYDGYATLVDHNGNIIRSAESMGLKETQIEGSLIKILGLNPNNAEHANWVRNLMVSSGLTHSNNSDPEQWYWRGIHDVETTDAADNYIFGMHDLTGINMGKIIGLPAIAAMYQQMGSGTEAVDSFINKTYGSPIDLLNYSDISAAQWMLSYVYGQEQLHQINVNRDYYNFSLTYGIDTRRLSNGNVTYTQGFGTDSGMINLGSSSVANAAYLREIHTGEDFVSDGNTISVPGGYWTLLENYGHSAIYQLYGSSLRMRIQHADTDEIKNLVPNTVYGGDNAKILNYPSQLNGSGSGLHIHVDFTMRLPYNNGYTRQFVDSLNMKPGSQLEYMIAYYDINKVPMSGYPMNFRRY